MFCGNCGSPLKPGNLFCENCGNPIQKKSVVTHPPNQGLATSPIKNAPPPQLAQTPPHNIKTPKTKIRRNALGKKINFKIIVPIFLLIIIIIAVGINLVSMMNNSPQAKFNKCERELLRINVYENNYFFKNNEYTYDSNEISKAANLPISQIEADVNKYCSSAELSFMNWTFADNVFFATAKYACIKGRTRGKPEQQICLFMQFGQPTVVTPVAFSKSNPTECNCISGLE